MSEKDLISKVRKIEIKTKGLSNEIFAGRYHSAFKGRGMSFSEVREYRYGDDIRDIDWNVTARANKAHIKTYEEERELTMMLMIDVSGSRLFGTSQLLKRDLAAELSAVLAFSAAQNNDKIGCIFFSDKIEKYIPPKSGRTHILRIIRELLDFQPESTRTDIGQAIKFLSNVHKKRATTFILSDFMDVDTQAKQARFDSELRLASKRHDIVAIRLYDQREKDMPNVGAVNFQDAESGQSLWVDTSSKSVRENYSRQWQELNFILDTTLMRYKIDNVSISTSEDYVKPLIRLFKQR